MSETPRPASRFANTHIRRGEAHHNARLSEHDVIMLRAGLRQGRGVKETGRLYAIVPKHVRAIRDRRAWAHVPDSPATGQERPR